MGFVLIMMLIVKCLGAPFTPSRTIVHRRVQWLGYRPVCCECSTFAVPLVVLSPRRGCPVAVRQAPRTRESLGQTDPRVACRHTRADSRRCRAE
jgi:hypothetical protein